MKSRYILDKMNFGYAFWGVFIAGNILFGFMSIGMRLLLNEYSFTREVHLIIPIVTISYLFCSTYLVFVKASVSKNMKFVLLTLFLLISLLVFFLIGIPSPLNFIGWYLGRGIFMENWNLGFLMQILEVYYEQ